jgi:putative cell wall-binding protein
MMRKPNKTLISGCMALALTMSSAFLPPLAMAAPVNTQAVSEDVVRLAGIDRYETAAKIAQQGWSTAEYAVLSAGMDENLVDALTAAPVAKAKIAPILLTEGTSLNANAEKELVRLGVKTVYVTSGTGVIQQPVLDKLTSMGIAIKPLGGSDRFETALNIAKELPKFSELVVTTAWTNADALSVASIAAAKGVPILLSDVQSMPSSVSDYVNSVKAQVSKTYVLGGTGVVSEAVKAALPSAERIGGVDRYATNQAILEAFASDLKPGQVFVANGQNSHLVDSLAAAPLAGKSKSPVVLIDGQLSVATKNYMKLNLLTNKVVALGGETVVGSEVSSLTAATVYAEEGAVKGSTDAANPEAIQDVLKITGKNVSVKNAKAEYSIYVQGDNVTLDNVTVVGTVFVDPGEAGTATLKGVKANKIVVMSGAKDSIHLENTSAGTLQVSSDSQTRVVATGTTQVGNTVVTAYAILDANGGNMGVVTVTTEPGKVASVELRGTFTEAVVVKGEVTLKASANAVVPSVIVQTQSAEQKVTLDGAFKSVEVKTEAKVDLAADAKVEKMDTTAAKVTVTVPPSAKIDALDAGTSGSLVGGGGTVNNQTTTTTPSTPPPSTTNPPAGGGGGGIQTTAFALQSATVSVSGAAQSTYSTTQSGNTWTVNLPSSGTVTGINLNVNRAAKLKIGLNTITLAMGNNPLSDLSLLSVTDGGTQGVTIQTLKNSADANGYITVNAILEDSNDSTQKISLTFKAYVGNVSTIGTNTIGSVTLNENNSSISISAVNTSPYSFDVSQLSASNRILSLTFNGATTGTLVVGGKTFDLATKKTILFEDMVNGSGNDGVLVSSIKPFADTEGKITVYGTINGVSIQFVLTGLNSVQ